MRLDSQLNLLHGPVRGPASHRASQHDSVFLSNTPEFQRTLLLRGLPLPSGVTFPQEIEVFTGQISFFSCFACGWFGGNFLFLIPKSFFSGSIPRLKYKINRNGNWLFLSSRNKVSVTKSWEAIISQPRTGHDGVYFFVTFHSGAVHSMDGLGWETVRWLWRAKLQSQGARRPKASSLWNRRKAGQPWLFEVADDYSCILFVLETERNLRDPLVQASNDRCRKWWKGWIKIS